MSNRTKEINKITTTIISISVKLIVYALIVLLLYEAVTKGYAFGHEVFYAEAVEKPPGREVTVQIDQEASISGAAELLARKGLIKSEFAFIFQSKFYDYDTVYPGAYVLNTSMTSKEILQILNEKPEENASPVQSGKTQAKPAFETAPSAAGIMAAPEAAGEEFDATQTPAVQDQKANAYDREDGDYYADEEQEMEGGWIEDAAEDDTP